MKTDIKFYIFLLFIFLLGTSMGFMSKLFFTDGITLTSEKQNDTTLSAKQEENQENKIFNAIYKEKTVARKGLYEIVTDETEGTLYMIHKGGKTKFAFRLDHADGKPKLYSEYFNENGKLKDN